MNTGFPPTRDEALARLAAIDPARYARTRNALDGAVTRLSPYLTHGILTVPEVARALLARGVPPGHRLLFELAWREYWHHVWRECGDGIFHAVRPENEPPCVHREVPPDVREARTGVPVIDAAVRALYEDGYVHNHARMWLASYLVHLRKVDWRAGARWFQAHLLDGDLASNTLSWQWVAGTFTGRRYLFNDENVRRYAPDLSRAGTAIDRSYEELDRIADGAVPVGPEPGAPAAGVEEPGTCPTIPVVSTPVPPVRELRVALIHPWMLGDRPDCDVAVGVIHVPHHAAHPWSRRRWSFVLERMRAVTDAIHAGDLRDLAGILASARSRESIGTQCPGYAEALGSVCDVVVPAPRAFTEPARPCRSFSRYWQQVSLAP